LGRIANAYEGAAARAGTAAREAFAEAFADDALDVPDLGLEVLARASRQSASQFRAAYQDIFRGLSLPLESWEALRLAVVAAGDAAEGSLDGVATSAANVEAAMARAGGAAAREMGAATDAMDRLARAGEQVSSTFERGFVNAVTRAESLRDAVGGVLTQLAQMAATAAFRGLFGGVFAPGGALGGFARLFSYAGGGYTGDAPRTGGLDGRGGFLAVMHPRETVIDHMRGASVASRVLTGQSIASRSINDNQQITLRLLISEAPGFAATVRAEATGAAVRVVTEYDRDVLPESLQRVRADPFRRG